MAPARPPWNRTRTLKLLAKTAVGLVVVWAVGRHALRTWADLKARGGSIHVDPSWVVVAGLLYLAGLTGCGVFYGRILSASATPIPIGAAVRAYLISHLGKYVPGKAMVVVMRVGLSTPFGARVSTATIATFYETLVMMASGSLLAAFGFATGTGRERLVPLGLAAALAAAFLVVVNPLVFPKVARLAARPFREIGPEAWPNVSGRLLGQGLAWTFAGWVLLGLSQVALIRAARPEGVAPGLWPLVAGSVALATVAGFVVAVLPGGLGVREGVLMTTLGPVIGQDTAVFAALGLRLTWLAAEILAGAVLAAWRPAGVVKPPDAFEDLPPNPPPVHEAL